MRYAAQAYDELATLACAATDRAEMDRVLNIVNTIVAEQTVMLNVDSARALVSMAYRVSAHRFKGLSKAEALMQYPVTETERKLIAARRQMKEAA